MGSCETLILPLTWYLTKMLKAHFLVILSLVIAIQSLNCPVEDQDGIKHCRKAALVSEYGQKLWRNDKYEKCQDLEGGINCAKEINEDCAKNAWFAFRGAFGNGFLREDGPRAVTANQTCIHQRFDEYFNQNGQCSYQDIKEIYTCTGNKWRETEFVDRDWWCRVAQVTKACIQESYETCMGFFQDQVKIFIEDYYGQGGGYYGQDHSSSGQDERCMPACLIPYLWGK